MRTSPNLGGATSTVSMTSGFPGSQATAARQDMGCHYQQKQKIGINIV